MADPGAIFRALADPTRRQILQDLKGGELAAGEISARYPIRAPSISRHLAVLLAAGLVAQRREGTRLLYRLEAETLAHQLGDFLSALCPTQIRERRRRGR